MFILKCNHPLQEYTTEVLLCLFCQRHIGLAAKRDKFLHQDPRPLLYFCVNMQFFLVCQKVLWVGTRSLHLCPFFFFFFSEI